MSMSLQRMCHVTNLVSFVVGLQLLRLFHDFIVPNSKSKIKTCVSSDMWAQ